MGAICWWIFFVIGLLVTGASVVEENEDGTSENDIGLEKADDCFRIDDEDADLTVPQLITKYGYKMENHVVETEDGYLLTMFRILPRQAPISKKFPVLIIHGLLGSSADFVISGPNNSLAYILADNGYDVWLGNVRGSRYSKDHSSMSTDSKEYWDFTWHEMGYYDSPAMIDRVLNTTGSKKLHFIGHSQGTTTYFAMSCSRPDYNGKVVLMTALSPAVILKRIRSPVLRLMLDIADPLKEVLDTLNVYEFLPYNANNIRIARSLCPHEQKNNICSQLVGQITGPHPEMYDQKVALAYMGHSPAGASTKQMMHFVQLVRSGLFRQYDYGKKGNQQSYNDWKPPNYNLSVSSAPVQIFYGLNDWMVHPRDVQQFAKMLPQLISAVQIPDKKFNHLDFIMAKNVRSQVYDKLMAVLEQYNSFNN
ncbi:lipase 1-like [Toxorhynchites rutilus septentrionalis]|uniref:lipase 1-like n=1 Tax=Toxorhynchites rutilus septentrionalis TaxID=329112 RepID=UPI0024797EC9|nr:lipase 1-like [Toxorhynchites rutilus septentrionalis]